MAETAITDSYGTSVTDSYGSAITDQPIMCMITNLNGVAGPASSEQHNFEFNSMVNFNGSKFGANETGLHEICTGNTDNGIPIASYFVLATTDFGIQNYKHLRKVYIGFETAGNLTIELTADGRTVRSYQIVPSVTGQQRISVSIGRDIFGRYWSTKISNVRGSNFSIDKIEVLPIVKSSGVK